jgi:hypothetical protein
MQRWRLSRSPFCSGSGCRLSADLATWPQIAAVLLVLAGAFMLRETKNDLRENKNALGEGTLHEREAASNPEEQRAQASGNRGAA